MKDVVETKGEGTSMLKIVYQSLNYDDVPGEICLSLSFGNCSKKCQGCHSPELAEDIGIPVDKGEIIEYIAQHGVTCVVFLGDNWDVLDAEAIRCHAALAWYTGLYEEITDVPLLMKTLFRYIKVGSYKQGLGGLCSEKTNQRMYLMNENGTIEREVRFV
jgi:anaerobic ribonucleoside-triphosphate reductase activating protein